VWVLEVVRYLARRLAERSRPLGLESACAAELQFAGHRRVSHGRGEYGRGEIHTNTIEGYFSIFKRGMRGVYQWCGEKHLHRYLAEFDFRYSNREANGVDDRARADNLLRGVAGKRLTYQTASARA
jgi:hypothetical protein